MSGIRPPVEMAETELRLKEFYESRHNGRKFFILWDKGGGECMVFRRLLFFFSLNKLTVYVGSILVGDLTVVQRKNFDPPPPPKFRRGSRSKNTIKQSQIFRKFCPCFLRHFSSNFFSPIFLKTFFGLFFWNFYSWNFWKNHVWQRIIWKKIGEKNLEKIVVKNTGKIFWKFGFVL